MRRADLVLFLAGPEREDERPLRADGSGRERPARSRGARRCRRRCRRRRGGSTPSTRPRWSTCAPRTTASSFSAGSLPGRTPTTFRVRPSRSTEVARSVANAPARARGASSAFGRRAEERLEDGGRAPGDERLRVRRLVEGAEGERPGLLLPRQPRRPLLSLDGEDADRAERLRRLHLLRPALLGVPVGPAGGERLRPPRLSRGKPLADDDDLPLHVEALVVVARRRRLADAEAGEDDRRGDASRRLRPARRRRRRSGTSGVSLVSRDRRSSSTEPPGSRISRIGTGWNQLRPLPAASGPANGSTPARASWAAAYSSAASRPGAAEAAPLERRRREEPHVRAERLGPHPVDGGAERRGERLRGAGKDEVGGRVLRRRRRAPSRSGPRPGRRGRRGPRDARQTANRAFTAPPTHFSLSLRTRELLEPLGDDRRRRSRRPAAPR